jgi:hypothetical protein
VDDVILVAGRTDFIFRVVAFLPGQNDVEPEQEVKQLRRLKLLFQSD